MFNKHLSCICETLCVNGVRNVHVCTTCGVQTRQFVLMDLKPWCKCTVHTCLSTTHKYTHTYTHIHTHTEHRLRTRVICTLRMYTHMHPYGVQGPAIIILCAQCEVNSSIGPNCLPYVTLVIQLCNLCNLCTIIKRLCRKVKKTERINVLTV